MKDETTIRYPQLARAVMQALAQVNPAIDALGLDRMLHHLVVLRASQINGCAHCVKMHTREAREDGESNERLDRLVVWRHVDDYTPREKAALAFTEAMTRLDDQSVLPELRAALREHFTEQEVAALGADVAMINLWNRISISNQ
ncbi:carboxymuconolactone decarboxylase family protein [Luteimonas mephitis]|uniref:carboxymuconolactone decarboxylase family protein n=1 Tax=Luteimonas mephitis TaxID=83615 RepID=UPI00040A3A95|nr:carboxymuconolactone decarboxylase family protein [Luteimonas mephitis]